MDDDRLNQEFAKFGSISSAKIMRDGNVKSRGFGFVCFSQPDEATKAVTEMNGRMLDGKPLYVALAQRKEMRRAQLETQYAARQKMGVPGPNQGMLTNQGPLPPQMYPGQQQPMFLGGIPPQQSRNYMYPQQVVPRWAGPQQSPAMMGVRPHPGVNYQLMPVNPRVPGGGMPGVGVGVNGQGPRGGQNQQQNRGQNQQQQQQQQNRGPRGPQQTQQVPFPQQQQQLPQQQQGQGPNIRYAENVRNRGGTNVQPLVQQQSQQQPEIVMPLPNEPLTIKALAAAPEDMRKQMIGERLFPLIKLQEPLLAGKITGMLLEMDNGELIHLLESQQALHEKIHEALQVLQQHPGVTGEEQQQEEDGDKN